MRMWLSIFFLINLNWGKESEEYRTQNLLNIELFIQMISIEIEAFKCDYY